MISGDEVVVLLSVVQSSSSRAVGAGWLAVCLSCARVRCWNLRSRGFSPPSNLSPSKISLSLDSKRARDRPARNDMAYPPKNKFHQTRINSL